ncbi:cytochrome P450 CYP736A12-like [Pyrus ussuriensis x Pyrus communis]|uniref:Cytochrome P450 CYP736A12-like n=1 Tax=Pyrus ussuriensis x Pyrus communis TaxID=2448454 RepID=A0A5N5GNP0_9ROSA|nr:cytochrome P450 CYP736A12-like [Pyrus ussuriensis x Pyrus communis]
MKGKEKCSIKFNSWKMVPVDMKNSMVQQLSVVWDVDETDEKQRKYVDDLFKKQFLQWKFDVQRATECAQVDNAVVDAPLDDAEEE